MDQTPSPYVPGDCLPGLLENVWVPVTYQTLEQRVRAVTVGDAPPVNDCVTVMGYWRSEHHESLVSPSLCTLDARRPEVRDRLSRVLAAVLGMPVGATAPEWSHWDGSYILGEHDDSKSPGFDGDAEEARHWSWHHVPTLATIPLDHPHRDALALACVARWVGAELAAGRITDRRNR